MEVSEVRIYGVLLSVILPIVPFNVKSIKTGINRVWTWSYLTWQTGPAPVTRFDNILVLNFRIDSVLQCYSTTHQGKSDFNSIEDNSCGYRGLQSDSLSNCLLSTIILAEFDVIS